MSSAKQDHLITDPAEKAPPARKSWTMRPIEPGDKTAVLYPNWRGRGFTITVDIDDVDQSPEEVLRIIAERLGPP